MTIKDKEVTTNFNQSLTINNTYIRKISNEIFCGPLRLAGKWAKR